VLPVSENTHFIRDSSEEIGTHDTFQLTAHSLPNDATEGYHTSRRQHPFKLLACASHMSDPNAPPVDQIRDAFFFGRRTPSLQNAS